MTTGRVALRAGAAIAAVLTATTLSRPEAAATRTRQPDAVHPQPRPWAPLVDGTIGTRFETDADARYAVGLVEPTTWATRRPEARMPSRRSPLFSCAELVTTSPPGSRRIA